MVSGPYPPKTIFFNTSERKGEAMLSTGLISEVQETVARAFALSRAELLSRSRRRAVTEARAVAMYVCRGLGAADAAGRRGWASFPRLGQAFARDHTSVIHACQTVAERRRTDREFAARIAAILSELDPATAGEAR